MNTPLRRVGLAMLAMVVLLLANATYIQMVKADDYRADARNRRVLLEEYSRQRGKILTSDEVIIANVKPTNSSPQYQRVYENGPLYAPITGYYSLRYGSTGLESSENEILNGSDNRLFVRRLSDLITGRDPRGGNVVTTINSKVQNAAYEAMTTNGFTGAVVAIKPDDGQILAMVSTPSYDPNGLATLDAAAQGKVWTGYNDDPAKPMLNRSISENYAPGSTFKVITAAAALAEGKDKNSQVTTSAGINVINGDTNCELSASTCLANFSRSSCGDGTLITALAKSCNTAFAQLADQVGKDKLISQASKFGVGQTDLKIPMSVVPSCVGPRAQCMTIPDRPSLFVSGIGQKDVRMTALENASVAATVANGGSRMRPQLVWKVLAPDLDEISGYDPDEVDQAMSGSDANELRDMMLESEKNTCKCANEANIASKTGTAETGADPKTTPPFAWYIAFAPAENPQIAVAVVVESKDVAATGGKLAAGVGRSTMNALVGGS